MIILDVKSLQKLNLNEIKALKLICGKSTETVILPGLLKTAVDI